MKHYYAGYNSYGTSFPYDAANGWSVYAFRSKKTRDNWVKNDKATNGATREAITLKNAKRIMADKEAWTFNY